MVGLLVSANLLDPTSKFETITQIRIYPVQENPKVERECTVIENAEEIKAFMEIFRGATIQGEVPSEKRIQSGISEYQLYHGDEKLHSYYFNGNDTLQIFVQDKLYYVNYPQKNPYELYLMFKSNE